MNAKNKVALPDCVVRGKIDITKVLEEAKIGSPAPKYVTDTIEKKLASAIKEIISPAGLQEAEATGLRKKLKEITEAQKGKGDGQSKKDATAGKSGEEKPA